MESSESERRRRIKQNRRKERAEKVEKERATNDPDDDNMHDVGPPVKKPRRKPRKPVAEEDIVDGFAILAFKNYDDLTRAIKLGEDDSSHKKIPCVQLLRRSQEGGDSKSTEKEKKTKKTKSNCTLSKPFKENGEIMVDKVPGVDIRSNTPSSGSPYLHPKKLGRINGPCSKDSLHNIICESDDNGDKVSDGCSNLFAIPRKDSSPQSPDNLHSSTEEKVVDFQRHQNYTEKKPPSPSSTVVNSIPIVEVNVQQPRNDPVDYILTKPLLKNGSLSSDIGSENINGHVTHVEPSPGVISQPVKENIVFQQQKTTVPQTLFTPYAATAITRVSTPIASVTTQPEVPERPEDPLIQPTQPKNLQYLHSHRIGSDTLPGSNVNPGSNVPNITNRIELNPVLPVGICSHHSPSPVVEKTVSAKPPNALLPVSSQPFNRKPFSLSGKVTPTSSKSAAFGSIARFLDSPTTSGNSPTANATVTTSTNYNSLNHQSFSGGIINGSSIQNIGPSVPTTCSSRSHSPRGHSPSRERDSYSSNVSSLSRTSLTPVSCSSQLPPNLSPLQNLQSYSKAVSWLNTVPGLSPVPRPIPPPPPHCSTSSTGPSGLVSGAGGGSLQISAGAPLLIAGGGSLSISAGSTPSPHSVFPGLVPGAPHPLPSHSSAAAMFAQPILPLSSMSQHNSPHPSPFGAATDVLFHGSSTSSELVRRDLESRFLSSDRSLSAGPSTFMSRPGDLHSHHHPLMPQLSGVNHLPPQSPGASNQSSLHSAHFPPPLFKEMPKVGMDSSFYRSSIGMPYPGYNGMLPPNLATTPFAPPSQIAAFTPKISDACKPAKVMKSGRWNAMHVRIAWEIYQDQHKAGGSNNKSGNTPSSSTKNSIQVSSGNSNQIAPPQPNSSGLGVGAELHRQPHQHVYTGLSRPPEVGSASSFSASFPHHSGPSQNHRPQIESPHSLFLNSSPHLGPPLPRYTGFSGLGPTYGGLSGLGSSLLGRELSSLAALGSSQEHWHRSHRGPPFPASGQLAPGWHLQRNDRDVKTPNESRRHKEERIDKRIDSHLSESGRGSRDLSPYRDRSPVRPTRTPLENGDTDSRSSRSSDSHSAVHPSSNKSASPLMTERDKFLHQLSSDSKHQSLMSASHPSSIYYSRLFPGSPLSTPTTAWGSFPGVIDSGPRMSTSESYRLSFLQLSERERELSRLHPSMRPPLFSNGPFTNMPMVLGQPQHHPVSSGNTVSKNSPSSGGSLSLLNPSMSAAAVAAHNHLIHSSHMNRSNSPKPDELNPTMLLRTKDDSQSR